MKMINYSSIFLCLLIGSSFSLDFKNIYTIDNCNYFVDFKFFNLTEAGPRTSEGGLNVVTFRPAGGNFRRLVKVNVTVGGDGAVRAMELTVDRSFVEDRANGIFARDVAKSFLRAAVPKADAPKIGDLANEIEFPKELEGYEIARTVDLRSRTTETLPMIAAMTR